MLIISTQRQRLPSKTLSRDCVSPIKRSRAVLSRDHTQSVAGRVSFTIYSRSKQKRETDYFNLSYLVIN